MIISFEYSVFINDNFKKSQTNINGISVEKCALITNTLTVKVFKVASGCPLSQYHNVNHQIAKNIVT